VSFTAAVCIDNQSGVWRCVVRGGIDPPPSTSFSRLVDQAQLVLKAQGGQGSCVWSAVSGGRGWGGQGEPLLPLPLSREACGPRWESLIPGTRTPDQF